jgi:rhodanese-related sulfurtransferase
VHAVRPDDIYLSTRKRGEMLMAHDDLRITGDELKRRMSADEEFIVLDSRNPQAWAEATDKARGAIRVDLHAGDAALPKLPQNRPIVVYCT